MLFLSPWKASQSFGERYPVSEIAIVYGYKSQFVLDLRI